MNQYNSLKGAVITFDALISLLPILLIMFIGLSAFQTIGERTMNGIDEVEKQKNTIIIADYIVKEWLVDSDDVRIYPHVIRIEKVRSFDVSALSIKLSLKVDGIKLAELGEYENGICVQRVVFVKEVKRAGILEVCT